MISYGGSSLLSTLDLSRNTVECEWNRRMKFVMAGGGTGGHIHSQPWRLRKNCATGAMSPIFIGTRQGMEARLVPNAEVSHRVD